MFHWWVLSFKQCAKFQIALNVFSGAGVSNSNNRITSSCTRAMFFIISTIFCLNRMMEIVKRVLVSVFSLVLKSWIRQVLHLSEGEISCEQRVLPMIIMFELNILFCTVVFPWMCLSLESCCWYSGSHAWLQNFKYWPLACISLKPKLWSNAHKSLFSSKVFGDLL